VPAEFGCAVEMVTIDPFGSAGRSVELGTRSIQDRKRMSVCATTEGITMMDTASPKIAQLVADARTELKRLGIDTEGKRSDELLNMVREQRNNPARPQSQARVDRNPLDSAATHEKTSQ
jgi:hypothetical protein